ncbi:unnamed protein product, partial [Thlaspi arvense]
MGVTEETPDQIQQSDKGVDELQREVSILCTGCKESEADDLGEITRDEETEANTDKSKSVIVPLDEETEANTDKSKSAIVPLDEDTEANTDKSKSSIVPQGKTLSDLPDDLLIEILVRRADYRRFTTALADEVLVELLTDADLVSVADDFPELKRLELLECNRDSPTWHGLAHTIAVVRASSGSLRHLDIAFCEVTAAALETVRTLRTGMTVTSQGCPLSAALVA